MSLTNIGQFRDLLAFWQPRCRRNLGDYDAAEISANFGGFIRVLLEWENRERKEVTTDGKLGSDANGENA